MKVTTAGRAVELRDGSSVSFVLMGPNEAVRLVRFHDKLSPDTTLSRFFTVHPELSESEVHRFTHVDHRDREAIAAVVDGEIVGVARFDRLSEPSDAEVAFVVADAWQGRGLGTALFHRLAERARQLGVRRFIAETLPNNGRMLAVFRHAGLAMVERFADGVVLVELELAPGASERS